MSLLGADKHELQAGMWEMQYSIIHLNLGFMPKQIASDAPDDHSLNLAYPQKGLSRLQTQKTGEKKQDRGVLTHSLSMTILSVGGKWSGTRQGVGPQVSIAEELLF